MFKDLNYSICDINHTLWFKMPMCNQFFFSEKFRKDDQCSNQLGGFQGFMAQKAWTLQSGQAKVSSQIYLDGTYIRKFHI
jgi:uncharacterized protein YdeI (BOF family)